MSQQQLGMSVRRNCGSKALQLLKASSHDGWVTKLAIYQLMAALYVAFQITHDVFLIAAGGQHHGAAEGGRGRRRC